ncbi:MAG: AAA family ATPase [Pirellulales bacterium]
MNPIAGNFLQLVCDWKKIRPEDAKRFGAEFAFNGTEKVIRFPFYGPDGKKCSHFDIGGPDCADEKLRKGTNATGKPAGIFLPDSRRPQPGETWHVVEGVKDAAALLGLGYLAAGLPTSSMNKKFASLFRDVHVVILPDNDDAGQKGAKKTAKALAGIAASVKIARLPGEIKSEHGEDVRDILQRENGEQLVQEAIENATAIECATKKPEFASLMTSAELLAANLEVRYLIDQVLVEGQPAVIGGHSKTLKTSTTIDLAVSLATGTPFLGTFQARKKRVAVWSGESGAAPLRRLAIRIANARGVDLRDASLLWSFSLPKLSADDHLLWLEKVITDKKLEVVIVDPLYLSLLDAENAGLAGNVFAMGAKLIPLSEIGQRTGCTIIVLHHFRKGGQADREAEPAGLEMLAQAGVAEWARQWILLQRRSPYQCDGKHQLWMRAGGSAGHAGLWALDIDEGTLGEGAFDGSTSEDGRRWDVSLSSTSAAESGKDRQAKAMAAREQKKADQEAADIDRVTRFLRLHPQGATKTAIKTGSGINNSERLTKALLTLQERHRIRAVKVEKNKRPEDGFALLESNRESVILDPEQSDMFSAWNAQQIVT